MNAWSNWSGNVTATPASALHISDELDLIDKVQKYDRLRPVGSGHSFTPLAAIDAGPQIYLDGFDHVHVEDPNALTARVGVGSQLSSITQRLHELGQAFSNMGDIDDQTFGGALGTATHGTGKGFGCYSSTLNSLTLINGRGERVEAHKGDEIFQAMAVSLGTGGIITEGVVQNVSPYRLDRRRYVMNINDLLDEFDSRMSACRNVEFYYITHSGKGLVFQSEANDADYISRPPDRDQEGLAQLRMAGRILGRFPRLRKLALGLAIGQHASEHFVEDWHKAYPTDRGTIRFNETEYHVPADAGPTALREVIDLVERDFPDVYFPFEVRTVKADDLWLSPFYNRNSVSIAVHHDSTKPHEALMQAVEQVFRRYDGRPHWGKIHSLCANDLRTLYPRFDDAVAVRRDLDPNAKFVTPYLSDLLGV